MSAQNFDPSRRQVPQARPMPVQPVPGQPMPGQPMPGQSMPQPMPGYAPGYAMPAPPMMAAPITAQVVAPPVTPTTIARKTPTPKSGKIALVLSIIALFFALFRDPMGPIYRLNFNAFGGNLWGYDFESADGAYKSRLEIESSRDIAAMIAYESMMGQKRLKEKLDTLDIEKQKEIRVPDGPSASKKSDVTVLFISFKVDGKKKYDIEGMVKDEDTGFWKPTFVGAFSVESVDKELAKEISDWEAKN